MKYKTIIKDQRNEATNQHKPIDVPTLFNLICLCFN